MIAHRRLSSSKLEPTLEYQNIKISKYQNIKISNGQQPLIWLNCHHLQFEGIEPASHELITQPGDILTSMCHYTAYFH